MKSSTYFFHVKTKILAYFQIDISLLLRKLDTDYFFVWLVQSIHRNARNRVRGNGSFTDNFQVKIELH